MIEGYFKAIELGDSKSVRRMVREDRSLLGGKNQQGMSGVVVAMYHGHRRLAKMLVRMGEETDVFEAAMVGDATRVESLTREEGVADLFSTDGFTPLHFAAFFGNPRVAKALIQKGADVNAKARNRSGVRPLHSAAAGENLSVARMLLRAGADVNTTQEGGFTALHAAAQSGNVGLTRLALRWGANVDARTSDGRTPLEMTKVEGREAGSREDRGRVAKILKASSTKRIGC